MSILSFKIPYRTSWQLALLFPLVAMLAGAGWGYYFDTLYHDKFWYLAAGCVASYIVTYFVLGMPTDFFVWPPAEHNLYRQTSDDSYYELTITSFFASWIAVNQWSPDARIMSCIFLLIGAVTVIMAMASVLGDLHFNKNNL